MIPLTPAAGRLLGTLQFRADLGPMYLAHAARGRYAVIVTEMTTGGRLARVDAASRDTVNELDRAGLIEVATGERAVELPYAGRRHLDDRKLRQVELLRAGAATCPRCGAIGAEECTSKNGRRHAARPAVPEDVAPHPVDGCCPACGKWVALALRAEPPQWACIDIDCVYGSGRPLPRVRA